MVFNVLNYGALGDGSTNDTSAIQSTINACANAGGGRVLLEGGHTFRAGSIVLYSNVELYLEMGAVLKASDNIDDFALITSTDIQVSPDEQEEASASGQTDYSGAPRLFFIYANDAENVAINGRGTIDGNEEIFYGTVTKWHIDGAFYPRVPMLYLENIRHLTVKNVTLAHSAFWTVHMVGCYDCLIDGIRILNNLKMANCDGIDPDHCKNVRIVGCHIESADDCIALKNTTSAEQYGDCENITVMGCTLMSTSSALKIGSESVSGFRNIVVSNCTITNTNRAVSLQLRDKGSIENVIFTNLTVDTRVFSVEHYRCKGEPIAVTAMRRNEETQLGTIKNVCFDDIYCKGENGILVYGEEPGHISNISLRNVNISLVARSGWPKGQKDLRPCIGNTVLEGRVDGLYAHNAEGLYYDNLNVEFDSSMQEYAGEDVKID